MNQNQLAVEDLPAPAVVAAAAAAADAPSSEAKAPEAPAKYLWAGFTIRRLS